MNDIRVLIVEDDPMVLEVNKSFLLKTKGFSLVGEAQSGEHAYHAIKDKKPDLILLDMYLPDISGLELFYKIRNDRLPVDIIMITAARDAKTVQELTRLGAFDYLVKPFRFERFQQALENYARSRKKLTNKTELKQNDIDEYYRNTFEQQKELPKGLNEITMKQITDKLKEINQPVTAEQLAQNTGMARVTVRKYLDYLASISEVKIDLKYGTVGRPTKYYSL
ncbi:response regulator [Ureibacillus sp. FSL K6-8385]|uniref:Transcriptional regulatory protein n=1 Tax=Ureibacillus terrenus TaxID=118246 RepID=A0A540V0F8_9BACL|nr:response regulator [Ureibacillus terrenus]MED3662913.1 response regulator [Ureibacillus terrenus]MED3763782.1 response regulator [Ureibacillus terrenus]TQE90242.1 response regulator [Ureibacillus terrenus]